VKCSGRDAIFSRVVFRVVLLLEKRKGSALCGRMRIAFREPSAFRAFVRGNSRKRKGHSSGGVIGNLGKNR